jgi:hypothetical protein
MIVESLLSALHAREIRAAAQRIHGDLLITRTVLAMN